MLRAIRHHALASVAIISLVLIPLLAIAWGIGHERGDGFVIVSEQTSFGIYSWQGEVAVLLPAAYKDAYASGFHHFRIEPTFWFSDWRDSAVDTSPISVRCGWHAVGFGLNRGDQPCFLTGNSGIPYPYGPLALVLPTWFLIVLCAIAPLLWWRRRHRLLRASVALCPVCNYDLRGTPGRCPECGWKQEGPTAAMSSQPQ